MKEDAEYLRRLLEAFESAPGPVTDVLQLERAGMHIEDEQFICHMDLLHDQGLIRREDGKRGIGLERGADGFIQWSAIPLRLTAEGRKLLKAPPSTWASIKEELKSGGKAGVRDVGGKLLKAYAEKKLRSLLDV